METLPSPSRPIVVAAIVAVIGATLIAAVAGWAVHGTSILFTYAQNGLTWCL